MISSRSPFIIRINLVQGQFDPVLCHTSLGEVVGTDLLGTVSGTDLAPSGLCLCVVAVLPAPSRTDWNAGLAEALSLFCSWDFSILAGNHDTAGDMGQTDCGVGGIDTLAAVSGCTEHVKYCSHSYPGGSRFPLLPA